jgi:ammonia channel protein AmtB
MLNGTVAGLAGITPASGFINPEWAMLVGLILGNFFSHLIFLFRISN